MVVVDYDCDDGSHLCRAPWKRNPQALRRGFMRSANGVLLDARILESFCDRMIFL